MSVEVAYRDGARVRLRETEFAIRPTAGDRIRVGTLSPDEEDVYRVLFVEHSPRGLGDLLSGAPRAVVVVEPL